MKALLTFLGAVGVFAGASAQVTLYNGLDGSPDGGYWDTDGGIHDTGINWGGATGQLVTGVAGESTISNIEAFFLGSDGSSAATALYVQVYDLSTSTLTGSETITSFNETDSKFTSGVLNGDDKYDIDASVSIGGLVGGNQYIVSMQVQSPDKNYLGISHTGNQDTYIEDFSKLGFGPIYNEPTWTETGAFGISTDNSAFVSSDTMMDIQATPEPVSMGMLGVGIVAMLGRRRTARRLE